MRERRRKSQTMKASEVKSRLDSLMDDIVQNETQILVERDGIPVAAIVPIADLQRLGGLDALDDVARSVLEVMRAPFRDVPSEEIEQNTEYVLPAIKAENLAERKRAERSA